MPKPITVVSVTVTDTDALKVKFSEPVYLATYDGRSREWLAENEKGWIARVPEMDELGAYLWGLRLIEKQSDV